MQRTVEKRRSIRCIFMFILIGLSGVGVGLGETTSAKGNAADSSAIYPLKVSANGRYLVDRNNVPFLIVGDVPQTLVARISPAEASAYFNDRVAHGFNSLWINVLSAGPYYHACAEDGSTYDGIRPFTSYIAGGRDTAHYDLSKPNEAYFERVDQMLMLARKVGITVFLDPIETGQWVPTLLNNGVASAYAYGQYLGKRYRGFSNIVWLNGNDFNHWKDSHEDDVVRAVASGIKSMDPAHLQTIELNIWTSSSADDPTWLPLLSINSTYTYSPTYLQMWHSYNQVPVLPTFLVEGHYDLIDNGPEEYGTPSLLRRQEYWAMLSGGKGQLYGNAYTDEFMPGWKDYVDTVAVTQLMIWHSFFSSLPWQNLVPDEDHTVVTAGYGTSGSLKDRASKVDFCTASKTLDGTFVTAYLPTPRTVTVDMASLKGPAIGRWFDPTNGTYIAIAGGPFANSGSRQFTPPEKSANNDGDNDWVLLLDASGNSL